jgi:hypothetical protein
MPLEILFSGVVIAAVTWWIGTALGRLWTAHERLREKVDDSVTRITRLETLASASKEGDE